MGESSELEEGEMTCSNDEAVVELGVDLSYIDKKVQSVLGHLQKDFGEGALDLFGPKICGYGSFLHCYNHLPAVPSCQRCSLGNHAVQRISNQLPGKNVVQNFQSLPTTSCEVGSNQDPQNYQTSGSLLAQSPAKVRLTKGTATIPTNDLSVRKPIRVRIKMGSEILSQKVARVCNDLGLDDSSISPSQQPSESPFRILQEMTAIPVPEDLLMLPLPDSLLTLPYNQPVIKARNKPLSQTQNKLSDIIGCEETLSGKRRKMVDCIDAITWNETSSIGEMKKKKVSSSGQQARDNSACRLGGASSTKDELTNERTMQEGMRKDGETVPRLAFTKSNKIKVVGMHAVKEKKTYPTKLQQSSSLDLDNWAQCDSCETCRLLSFGLKPEQLPEKWLCSMQTWLEEETTNTIRSFHASDAHGPGTGVKLLFDASKADKSHQPLTSGSLPNLVEKKFVVNTLSQGVSSNILVDAAKPLRSNSHVLKIRNMKVPGETPNATQISTDLGGRFNSIEDKGTVSQIKIKKKKEGDKKESDGSKHIKTGDGNKLARGIKAEEMHSNQNLKLTPADQKTKRHENNLYTLDVERDTKKILLASQRKPEHRTQPTTGSSSLCTNSHGRISSPVRKIRLIGYKQGKNGYNSKLFSDGEEKELSLEKAIITQISAQDFKPHHGNELFQTDGSQEHRNVDASCRYWPGGSSQISGVETSSSSKVFGSHKSGRMYVEEVKVSPVDSVSSSPVRSLFPANLASAGGSISQKNKNLKYGDAECRFVNNRKPQSQDVNSETMDKSCQTAKDILEEAEKLRKTADCFKSSGLDNECKEANFKAALRFLHGASLLEMCSTQNMEGGKMSHVEAYNIAAKLSESCAHQFEKGQEMATAALAYKCTEVACMRVVYGRSRGLSGEWSELQKIVQMTPQGESPSSSASDIDTFNHQGVSDKSATTKRGLSYVAGNLLPVARRQLNFFSLINFTERMNLAM